MSKVLKTSDYNLFELIELNRPLNQMKVDRLVQSIKNKNLLPDFPLLVREREGKKGKGSLEILDGQHRFSAAMMLGEPVYYKVAEVAEIDDIAAANTEQSKWTMKDSLHHFTKKGVESYQIFAHFMAKYGFNITECMVLLSGNSDGGGAGRAFRQGRFTVGNYSEAIKLADQILDMAKFTTDVRQRSFVRAMIKIMGCEGYDHDRMVKKVELQSAKLRRSTDVAGYLEVFEEIYNYHSQDKLYFTQFLKEKKTRI